MYIYIYIYIYKYIYAKGWGLVRVSGASIGPDWNASPDTSCAPQTLRY